MRIYSTFYGRSYGKLAKVWLSSVKEHHPDDDVWCEESSPPKHMVERGAGNHVCGNTHKLELWVNKAKEAIDDGERIVLMDADTFVLGPLGDAFDQFEGDIGYTTRVYPVPFNAGVIFVNPTDAARRFLDEWLSENARLFSNRILSVTSRRKFGGVNQAAFSRTIRLNTCRLGMLPCEIYNCEQATWKMFSGNTRVVHVKAKLRDRVFSSEQGDLDGDALQKLVALFRQCELKASGELSQQCHAG